MTEDEIIRQELTEQLAGLPGWETKGEPYMDELLGFILRNFLDDETIEAVSDSLWSTQEGTLHGYVNYVKAWKTRYRQLYEKQPQIVEHRNGDRRGRYY